MTVHLDVNPIAPYNPAVEQRFPSTRRSCLRKIIAPEISRSQYLSIKSDILSIHAILPADGETAFGRACDE
jgi:hypothetical protein